MWNRQREAQMAREILEEVDDAPPAPDRNPLEVSAEGDNAADGKSEGPELVPTVDAAE
jgi:hypothetical protein